MERLRLKIAPFLEAATRPLYELIEKLQQELERQQKVSKQQQKEIERQRQELERLRKETMSRCPSVTFFQQYPEYSAEATQLSPLQDQQNSTSATML